MLLHPSHGAADAGIAPYLATMPATELAAAAEAVAVHISRLILCPPITANMQRMHWCLNAAVPLLLLLLLRRTSARPSMLSV
jgi:hypothetical protein